MINRTTLFYFQDIIDCKKLLIMGQNTLIYFAHNLFYKLISQKWCFVGDQRERED